MLRAEPSLNIYMNPPSFFALYTGRTNDPDADLMVIFANRDERTALDVHDTRTNLEAEGETVIVQPFDRLADIPDVLTPSVPSDPSVPEVRHTQAEARARGRSGLSWWR